MTVNLKRSQAQHIFNNFWALMSQNRYFSYKIPSLVRMRCKPGLSLKLRITFLNMGISVTEIFL